MDISFSNPFEFPLELCWVDLTSRSAPICYGTVAPSGEYNMSSFAGHSFITKRLAWSAAASTAAAATSGGAEAVPSTPAHATTTSPKPHLNPRPSPSPEPNPHPIRTLARCTSRGS